MTLQAIGLAAGRGVRPLFADIDLTVDAGEALLVAGSNGSGKTTLLRLLCGLTQPLSGQVLWRGRPHHNGPSASSGELVYLGHAPALKDDLSAVENLRVLSAVAGQPCTVAMAREALSVMGLSHWADLPARSLSQGQRRRVVLARLALARGTGLLVLDEPFAALDAQAQSGLSELLSRRLRAGDVLVYTTHQAQLLDARVQHIVRLDEAALRETA